MEHKDLLTIANPAMSEAVVIHHDLSCEMVTLSTISGKSVDVIRSAAWIVQHDSSPGKGDHFLAKLVEATYSPDKSHASFRIKKYHFTDTERYPNGSLKDVEPWFAGERC